MSIQRHNFKPYCEFRYGKLQNLTERVPLLPDIFNSSVPKHVHGRDGMQTTGGGRALARMCQIRCSSHYRSHQHPEGHQRSAESHRTGQLSTSSPKTHRDQVTQSWSHHSRTHPGEVVAEQEHDAVECGASYGRELEQTTEPAHQMRAEQVHTQTTRACRACRQLSCAHTLMLASSLMGSRQDRTSLLSNSSSEEGKECLGGGGGEE